MAEIRHSESKNNSIPFKLSQLIIPLLIGIVAIGWLFLSEFDPTSFTEVRFNMYSIGFIALAFLLMFARDFGLIWRFRLMTNKDLSWKQGFFINLLSEFTSAITPSAIGGSGLVVLFLNKEGINVGRGTAIMLTNLFLDELFFILVCPFIFLFIPLNELFNATSVITSTIGIVFWSVYSILVIWTILLFIGLFLRPDIIAKLVQFVFKLPFLRRWQNQIESFAGSMVNASHEMGKKSITFWLKAFMTTAITWSARFFVVNVLFMAFSPINNQLVIFGRQLLLWIVMVASPTPGGSGISEFAFKEYYNDIALGSGPVLIITLIWRIISYYLYLLLGAIFIPKWINKSFKKKQLSTDLTNNSL